MLLLVLLSFSVVSYSGSCLKFLVIGDWGGVPFFPYKTLVEMNVGRQMAFLSMKKNVDFILTVGDNFYLEGVQDVNDPRFKETFETAFNYTSLNIPWFVIAGNHDHYGNVSAQIMYSSKSTRWNFPDFYYKKNFKLDDSVTLDLVMTDSIILCGNTKFESYSQPSLHPADSYRSEKHWQWLEDTLKSSKANYLLVCGHFPIYSVGSHGSTDCLVERLHPLLNKYNVTAYFSGHDHNMQVFCFRLQRQFGLHVKVFSFPSDEQLKQKWIESIPKANLKITKASKHVQVKNGTLVMDYFVSGSAGFVDPSKKHHEKIPPDSLLFHWANPFSLGAFNYVEINAKNMTVSFVIDAKEIYSYSKEPRF